MVKKLRRKFVEVTMLSVFVMLFILMFAINLANYRSVNEQIDHRLAFLEQIGAEERELGPEVIEILGRNGLTLESVFDMRYFSVLVSESGEVLNVNLGKIASVSEEQARAMADTVHSDGGDGGFFENYKYSVSEKDGGTLYIFLDCDRELQSFSSFLTISFIISVIALVLVFFLVMIFARVVTHPMAESYEKQRRFITDAGHELKTPLTIIRANAEVIEMEGGESEWTESIKKQTERLTELTEKLVFLSRMEEPADSMQMAEFCLSDTVQDTVGAFSPVASANGIGFTYEIEPSLSLHGNAAAIEQLLTLLLDNAFKYTERGGRVFVSLTGNGRSRRLTVKNTVEQISVGNHDRLFERFYRADHSRNSEKGGHGIGLAVAAAIVQAHKGKITAKSEDGKSLTVAISL